MTRLVHTAARLPGLTGLRPGDLVEVFGRTRTVATVQGSRVTFTDGTTSDTRRRADQ